MNEVGAALPLNRVAFVGAFLPRRCQTSGTTTRLYNTFRGEFTGCECLAVAISDGLYLYPYPSRVRFEIRQGSPNAYRAAGEFLTQNEIELVCVQYDAEIFQGAEGKHLAALLRSLKMPVVIVFNQDTVLETAADSVIGDLGFLSTRVMVSQPQMGAELREKHGVAAEKVLLQRFPAQDGLPDDDHSSWRALAQDYMTCFQGCRKEAAQRLAQHIAASHSIPITGGADGDGADQTGELAGSADHGAALPVLKLDHFLRMTDETGMLRGSVLSLPDYSQGYATADNARALMFSLLLEQVGEGPFIPIEMQASRHLAFLWNAFNAERGRFRDALSYRRDWLDEEGSEDTHGLALWALGMTLGRSTHPAMQGVARRLFETALPAVKQFSSLRAWGFSLLGIDEYLARFAGDRVVARTGKLLLDRLTNQFQAVSTTDWPWFEEALGGSSASISQALVASSRWAEDDRAVDAGIKSLEWLARLQFSEDGMFAPLGDQGYYRRGGQPARFVQRPIEARGMISACLEAYRYTGDERWLKYARGAFQWFLGRNELGQPLYDAETGGCCSGLMPGKMDLNYSAEALLAFLVAQLEMRLFEQISQGRRSPKLRLPILQIGPELHIDSQDR